MERLISGQALAQCQFSWHTNKQLAIQPATLTVNMDKMNECNKCSTQLISSLEKTDINEYMARTKQECHGLLSHECNELNPV
jgi:hypothetical protein